MSPSHVAAVVLILAMFSALLCVFKFSFVTDKIKSAASEKIAKLFIVLYGIIPICLAVSDFKSRSCEGVFVPQMIGCGVTVTSSYVYYKLG
jgi:hypothetical protein